MKTTHQNDTLPLISIIIPVHNRKDYVQIAIQSALEQTYSNIEIIVVDDASNDDTYDTLKDLQLPITLLQNKKNKGPAGSRNVGIEACLGQYLFFLDSDDALQPAGIETLWKVLKKQEEQDPAWGIAYGKRLTCDANLNPVQVKPRKYYTGFILPYLLQENMVRTGTYLLKKDIAMEIHGFSADLYDHEDFLFCCLIAIKYKFVFIDQYISKFRRHAKDRVRDNYQKILKPEITHLDYFFEKSNILEPNILMLKNKVYASEHLRMSKMAWRASLSNEYLFHWKKTIAYNTFHLLHPKYTLRALISAFKS